MITLNKVNKYFYRHKKNELHVINNTSIDFPDKGLVALLGPSGCGKTTLLNAIGGLDKVANGSIYVNGHKITKRCAYKVDKIRNLNIGYIFQNYYLIENKTVFDNVALSLKMLGIKDKEEIKKRVTYVLETLGIYRYRNRPCNMLSGGERQRVGIARAIVKNPNIIIADEPTGNLDSGNTIEIMNIIKSISKERLVILVTHETDIAKFYADRIVEIEDGQIKNDYENKHDNDLDYRMDNKIYLKDFKHKSHFENDDNEIDIYNDNKNDLKLSIVVKGNNIYIKGGKNQKLEIIDSDSNIELINDHYKKIDKSVYEKYEFDFENVIDKSQKLRYSSIYNPITLLLSGFKQIFNYSFIKKLLLLGFLASGAFVAYAVSNTFGVLREQRADFIEKYERYYDIQNPDIAVNVFEKYEDLDGVDYILPGTSIVYFSLPTPYYYQLVGSNTAIGGSLTSDTYINDDEIIYGRNIENAYEIVVDKMIIDKMVKTGDDGKYAGLLDEKDYLGKEVYAGSMKPFTIVGISDTENYAIYAKENMLIDIVHNAADSRYISLDYHAETYMDYTLFDKITIEKGRLPENDYEVLLPSKLYFQYEINKAYEDFKINNKKLTVVGFYKVENGYDDYLVNSNMLKYHTIEIKNNLTVMPYDVEKVVTSFNDININITSSYETSLKKYELYREQSVKASLTVSAVILIISFVEIYLMVRSSFLSRIKEIGILRAIGVKKTDIYKLFFGEIFAITTVACVPGVLFMSYVLSSLTQVSYIDSNYLVNGFTIILSIALIYAFNMIVGLLPVYGVVRMAPASILARKDIE